MNLMNILNASQVVVALAAVVVVPEDALVLFMNLLNATQLLCLKMLMLFMNLMNEIVVVVGLAAAAVVVVVLKDACAVHEYHNVVLVAAAKDFDAVFDA